MSIDQSTKIKIKLSNRNDVLGAELVDKLVLMLAVEGGFVELGDGVEGGDVGGGAEGGFVKLGDRAKGGDVGGEAERVSFGLRESESENDKWEK